MKERKKIAATEKTFDKVKEASEKLGIPMSEVVRRSTEYVMNNNIDICKDLEERDELFVNLREKLINRFGTLTEAAKQLGVSYWTIRKYCRKEFYPSKSIMTKLSRMLDQKF